MTVREIFETNLVNDFTKLVIRSSKLQLIDTGFWYHDNILKSFDCEVESFTWRKDNTLYVYMEDYNPVSSSNFSEIECLKAELQQCKAYIAELEKYKTLVTDIACMLESTDVKAGV